jgi:catalase
MDSGFRDRPTAHIRQRGIAHCKHADPDYGEGLARALGLDLKLAAE